MLDALLTLATTQTRLANHDVTVHKLRKLLGIEKSSEKLAGLPFYRQSSIQKLLEVKITASTVFD